VLSLSTSIKPRHGFGEEKRKKGKDLQRISGYIVACNTTTPQASVRLHRESNNNHWTWEKETSRSILFITFYTSSENNQTYFTIETILSV